MSVRLTLAEEKFLQSVVELGRYASISDALSAAVDAARVRFARDEQEILVDGGRARIRHF